MLGRSVVLIACLWAALAHGEVIPKLVGNADTTLANGDWYVATSTALTAPRTLTLPQAARACIRTTADAVCPANVLEIADLANAISGANTLRIAPRPGDTINGSAAPIVMSTPGASVYLRPLSDNRWILTGSSSAGVMVGQGYTYIDVKSDFNARGDTVVLGDGIMDPALAPPDNRRLTSATAVFTSGDIGKQIAVEQAGNALGTVPLVTTITEFISATQVRLAAPAQFKVGTWFFYQLVVGNLTARVGYSGYVPLQTITDGATVAQVDATQLAGVTGIIAGGSGGYLSETGAASGTCLVKGRSGNGQDGATAWNAGTNYNALGTLVIGSDNLTYSAIATGNLNHDPTTSPTWWKPWFLPSAFEALVTLTNGVVTGLSGVSSWSAVTTYGAATRVLGSDGKVYASIAAGNLNHDPTGAPGFWNLAATGLPVFNPGAYTTNPFNLSSEPVISIDGTSGSCRGLTGAILSITMAPYMVRITTRGQYTTDQTGRSFCLAPNPVCTTASPAGGTGATFLAQSVRTGAFAYGTDDTTAFTDAFTLSNSMNRAGPSASCIFVPTGKYWIAAPLPRWTSPGCIKGVSNAATELIISPAMTGTVLSWRESWPGTQVVVGTIVNGASFDYGFGNKTTGGINGAWLENIKLNASRNSPNEQNAVVFYDRNSSINLKSLVLHGFNGWCLATGINDTTTRAAIFESDFTDLNVNACGKLAVGGDPTTAKPAILFDTQTTASSQGTNSIRVDNVQVFANFGHGISWRATGGTGAATAGFHMQKVRVEGIQFGPVLFDNGTADLMHIGDPADGAGRVSDIFCLDCTLTTPYLNNYALRLSGPANAPFGVDWHGEMNGNAGGGGGVKMTTGFGNVFKFRAFSTPGCDITMDATSTGGVIASTGMNDKNFKYCIVGTSTRLAHPVLSQEIPQPYCTSLSGPNSSNRCTGNNTTVVGGSAGRDHGRTATTVFPSGFGFSAGTTPIQSTVTTLGCSIAVNGGSCTLTTDAQPPNPTNCVNIPDNTTVKLLVDLKAHNRVTFGNYYIAMWSGLHTMSRGTGAASTLVDGVTTNIVPDASTFVGATTGTAIMKADTVNGCLSIVHTQGATAQTHFITAQVRTLE